MRWFSCGALAAALAISAGAFGAHALEARLAADRLDLWETGARYLMYGALGLMAVGLLSRSLGRDLAAAGRSLVGGAAIFSGTVFALALGGPRWLGAITPIGGLLLIAGFLLAALAAWHERGVPYRR